MTHRDDRTRRLHTQHSSHSNLLHRLLDPMQRQALLNGSDRATICNRRLQRRRQRVVRVTMRSSCTTSRKACSTRRAPPYLRPNCSSMDRNTNHKSHDNRHSNTNSMVLVSCMACNKPNNKPNQHMTKYQLSGSRDRALHLRHSLLSLGSHQQVNTTLQEILCLLAHPLPTSRHLSYPHSIRRLHTHNLALQRNNPTQCLILRSRLRIRHITNKRSMLPRNHNSNSSHNNKPILSISCSTNINCQYGPSSRTHKMEPCGNRPIN
jgi:hypothetical protein